MTAFATGFRFVCTGGFVTCPNGPVDWPEYLVDCRELLPFDEIDWKELNEYPNDGMVWFCSNDWEGNALGLPKRKFVCKGPKPKRRKQKENRIKNLAWLASPINPDAYFTQ